LSPEFPFSMKQKLFLIDGHINVPHDFNNCDCTGCVDLVLKTDKFLDEVDVLINKHFSTYGNLDIKDSIISE